ncbi:hypothetical protein HYDPIDRAFT_23764, partial [Hydnomerulius pinastri MD-312]
MSNSIVVERALPTRGAAKKASASFAEQLMSSPTRSEDDHSDNDSPGSNPFGEPSSHRTKNVKYRYSATGKHLSSPLKGTSSSPEHKPVDKPKPKPRVKPFPAVTPSQASASASKGKGKGSASVLSSRKRKAPPSPVRRELTFSSLSALSPSPLSSAPTSPIGPTKDLPPSSTPTTKGTTPDAPARISRPKNTSMRSLVPAGSKVSIATQPLSTPRKRKDKGKADAGSDAWDVGSSVWVLVNESGMLANSSAQLGGDIELIEELMWWPAQIVQKQPLRASLFGDFPSTSSSSKGPCTILSPSPTNIQPINDANGLKRFTRSTFCLTSPPTPTSPSPKKKRRIEPTASTSTSSFSLEDRWESAVQ